MVGTCETAETYDAVHFGSTEADVASNPHATNLAWIGTEIYIYTTKYLEIIP